MLTTILRGARFRPTEAQATTVALAADEQLWLRAEPTNPYDPNAIQVFAATDSESDLVENGRIFIGYVAKEDCASVKALGDPESLLCFVDMPNGAQPQLRIELPSDDEYFPDDEDDSFEEADDD